MALRSPTAERKRIVTVVYNPEQEKENSLEAHPLRKKRVAAYARVSTEQDEQQSSYENQIEYYTGYIKSKPEWEFVDIYSDEGITGTNLKKRSGFNRMIEDAMNGKIDLILTKSISRFSRNTVDSLSITRQLKAKSVEVYFEKENISSMDPQAELLFTIMSSIAQEESRSISENVRWGKQRSMEAGKFSLAWSSFLGYKKGPDGLPEIVEEEAETVRKIYQMYLDGDSFKTIAEELTRQRVKTPMDKDVWSASTIRSILTNEKYIGDARLQKTYTVDFLTKETKVNNGERKQWYIHDSHDAIISPETFELVQKEIERRCSRKGSYYDSPFTDKVICGDCGGYYGHRVWHSNEPCRKHIWRCGDKYHHGTKCSTPKFEDHEMEKAFLMVANRLLAEKNNYIAKYQERFSPLIASTTELEAKLKALQTEYNEIIAEADQLLQANAAKGQDQEETRKHFDAMDVRIKAKKAEIEGIRTKIADTKARKKNIRIFLEALKGTSSLLYRFDTALWHRLVDYVTVTPEKTFVFHLRSGREMIIPLEEVH